MNDTDLDGLAAQAWIFGYPLVLMDATRPATAAHSGPTFEHLRAFPDHTFTDVVAPDVDTLSSTAWLDLRAEPVVLSMPPMSDRYHTMSMLSAWTDVFAAPGSRTTGDDGGDFAICPPGWSGDLPADVERIDAPTCLVWLLGRTSAAGTKDYLAVHTLQNNYLLTPLSEFALGLPAPRAVPPLAATTEQSAPAEQVARMDGPAFFTRLAELLVDNPPAGADAAFLAGLAALGLRPGVSPELTDPQVAQAVAAAPSAGQARLRQVGADLPDAAPNGWSLRRGLGAYGTDYARRAYVASAGLGATLDADAIYPHATVDAGGRALSGGHRYVLRFEPDGLPPVNGFWSLTLYDDKQFFVDNPIDRYAIGDRDDLAYGDDGSLDIWIQHDEPEDGKVSNWLPAPTGSFNLFFRAYWPRQAALDGSWAPPPITRLG